MVAYRWKFKDAAKAGIVLTSRVSGCGFPGGAVVKNLPANAGDKGSSPGPGKSHMPRSH